MSINRDRIVQQIFLILIHQNWAIHLQTPIFDNNLIRMLQRFSQGSHALKVCKHHCNTTSEKYFIKAKEDVFHVYKALFTDLQGWENSWKFAKLSQIFLAPLVFRWDYVSTETEFLIGLALK